MKVLGSDFLSHSVLESYLESNGCWEWKGKTGYGTKYT